MILTKTSIYNRPLANQIPARIISTGLENTSTFIGKAHINFYSTSTFFNAKYIVGRESRFQAIPQFNDRSFSSGFASNIYNKQNSFQAYDSESIESKKQSLDTNLIQNDIKHLENTLNDLDRRVSAALENSRHTIKRHDEFNNN